jgi:hypothetical protein
MRSTADPPASLTYAAGPRHHATPPNSTSVRAARRLFGGALSRIRTGTACSRGKSSLASSCLATRAWHPSIDKNSAVFRYSSPRAGGTVFMASHKPIGWARFGHGTARSVSKTRNWA